jgi:hypothetical protein
VSSKRRTRTLSLGGHKIKLYWRDIKWGTQDGSELHDVPLKGYFDAEDSSITIDPSLQETEISETLIHEALHAVAYRYNLTISHKDIHILATGLQQMLKPFLKKV